MSFENWSMSLSKVECVDELRPSLRVAEAAKVYCSLSSSPAADRHIAWRILWNMSRGDSFSGFGDYPGGSLNSPCVILPRDKFEFEDYREYRSDSWGEGSTYSDSKEAELFRRIKVILTFEVRVSDASHQIAMYGMGTEPIPPYSGGFRVEGFNSILVTGYFAKDKSVADGEWFANCCVQKGLDLKHAQALRTAIIRHLGLAELAEAEKIRAKWNWSAIRQHAEDIVAGRQPGGKINPRPEESQQALTAEAYTVLANVPQARNLLQQEKYQQANALLDAVLQHHPNYPDALFLCSRALLLQTKIITAVAEKIQLLARAQEQINRLIEAGNQYADANSLQRDVAEELALQQQHVNELYLQAKSWKEQADDNQDLSEKITLLEQAQSNLQKIHEVDAQGLGAKPLLDEVSDALPEVKSALDFQREVEAGFEMLTQQQFQEAVNYGAQLLTKHPENVSVLLLLGQSQKRYAESLDSKNKKMHFLQKAQETLQQATQKDNECDAVWMMLDEVEQALDALNLSASTQGSTRQLAAISSGESSDSSQPAAVVVTTVSGKALTFGNEVGRGSYGVVYQGICDGQQVAIKQFGVTRLEGEKLTKFLTEAHTMAQLKSTYLVAMYDMVAQPSNYCLVMEYMPYGSLWDVLHSDYPLTTEQRHTIAQDIIHGLKILHDRNIIHRDLKSLNVLIGNGMRAKVGDFGLAEMKQESSTSSRMSRAQIAGTLAWLAPEIVAEEKPHNKSTDMFSIGIVIWEIVTHQQPLANKNAAQITMAKVQRKNEAIPSDCPPRLAHLIQWCCKTNPKERPTAQQALASLSEDPTATGGVRLEMSTS